MNPTLQSVCKPNILQVCTRPKSPRISLGPGEWAFSAAEPRGLDLLSLLDSQLRKRDGARAPDSGAEDALLLAASDDGCAPRVMNVGLYNRSAALIAFRNGYSVPVKVSAMLLRVDAKHCSELKQLQIPPDPDRLTTGVLGFF